MTVEQIRDVASRLKRRHQEDDPERMCREVGVLVKRIPMGKSPAACKGFFLKKCRIKLIVVNADLPERYQRIILAHELGHAVLHASVADQHGFHDFGLFDETGMWEYEANVFAAEFLLEDEQVLEQLGRDSSFFGVARALRVPPELLDFKFRIMKRQGYTIDPPLYARSNFMKQIDRADRF